jgi:Family of unknown function (DUF6152)
MRNLHVKNSNYQKSGCQYPLRVARDDRRTTLGNLLARLQVTALLALMASGSAAAHHSFAMFDMQNELTLTGTVREFQFTNPHCFLQLLVADPAIAGEWSIELGAPVHLQRVGWKRNTVRPGDKITIKVNPLRNGQYGGNFISGIGANGKPLGGAL